MPLAEPLYLLISHRIGQLSSRGLGRRPKSRLSQYVHYVLPAKFRAVYRDHHPSGGKRASSSTVGQVRTLADRLVQVLAYWLEHAGQQLHGLGQAGPAESC